MKSCNPYSYLFYFLLVFQSLSPMQLFVTPWTVAGQAFLSFAIPQSLLKLMSTESVMPFNLLVLCHPLLLLPSIFASIRIFYKELAFPNRWPNIGVSASDLLMNIQDWFPLGLTGLLSLLSKGLSRVFSSTTVQKHRFFGPQPSYGTTLTSIHDYWKNHSFEYPDFAQTHVHWVGDVIQPSHPLSPPSSPALNLSQHQGL